MSYCINPKCLNRSNPEQLELCQSCGSSLLINGRYRVVECLRESNPAYPTDIFVVKDFSCEEADWGTLKVLKVLKASRHPEWLRLFKEAARALIWLRHPGIPRVEPDGYFQFFTHQNFQKLHCLVMERVAGINLNDWLKTNQIDSQDLIIEWLEQLTDLLAYLHKFQIIHRDIKPSNLILRSNNQLALIDFGTVAIAQSDRVKVGTIGYAAPEQIEGQAVLQSDFFALGRTFVHLLTGTHPNLLATHAKTGQLMWRASAPQISEALADLIDQLMELLPENRPKNTHSLRKRLAQLR